MMLDLCCGLGGASAPMRAAGWRVVSVDILAKVRPDIVADVRSLPLRDFTPDLLWASPPCTEYSKHGLPFWPKLVNPDLSLEMAILRIIAELRPRYWIVENVVASRAWYVPIFGPVRALNSGHVFYGKPPGLIPLTKPHKFNARKPNRHGRPLVYSLIPQEIGQSIVRQMSDEN